MLSMCDAALATDGPRAAGDSCDRPESPMSSGLPQFGTTCLMPEGAAPIWRFLLLVGEVWQLRVSNSTAPQGLANIHQPREFSRHELQRPRLPRARARRAAAPDTAHFSPARGRWHRGGSARWLARDSRRCGGDSGAAGVPEFRAKGEAHHLSFSKRRAVADGPFRPEAATRGAARRRPAGEHPQRTAADDHDQRAVEIPGRAEHVQVRSVWPKRRVVQRADAAHVGPRRRVDDHPLAPHRGDQSRSRDHFHADRLAARGPAEHRLVDGLRPRQQQRRPARVCRAHVLWQRTQGRPAAL